MRLVVDANVFIAAFMKDALTRELLLDSRLEFSTPEYGLLETREILRRPKILARLRLEPEDFEALWSALTASVNVIARSEYRSFMKEARRLLDDPKDIPYLACALKLNVPVWSNDPDFQKPGIRSRSKILTTGELLEEIHRQSPPTAS